MKEGDPVALMTWRDEYSVGIEEIDEEHKELISLINKAGAALFEQQEREAVVDVANDMIFYALTHFSNEEVLMVSHDYPEYEAHRGQHREFVARAKEIEKLLDDDEEYADSNALFTFLSQWLVQHIMCIDKKMAAFLVEKDGQ